MIRHSKEIIPCDDSDLAKTIAVQWLYNKCYMRLWAARFFIGIVLCFNIQCAFVFWMQPQHYAPAYELFGEAGEATVRGFGVLFLMWTVPYVIAMWNPVQNRVSLWEAIVMQGIGVVGEAFILQALPAEHILLRASILRFIVFDGVGLIALLISAGLSRSQIPRES